MSPFRKWVLGLGTAATTVSGVVYWWMKNMLAPLDPWAVIHHPLEPAMLKVHILAAPVLVFGVGLIAADHIWPHFRQRVRGARRSGILTMAVVAPMVVSGYLIQVITDPRWLTAVVWLHVATGAAFAVGLATHYATLRYEALRRRSRLRPAPSASDTAGAACHTMTAGR